MRGFSRTGFYHLTIYVITTCAGPPLPDTLVLGRAQEPTDTCPRAPLTHMSGLSLGLQGCSFHNGALPNVVIISL
jgi:hypothetical protein